jgi:tetratricopeptide (TPR) repeat protein
MSQTMSQKVRVTLTILGMGVLVAGCASMETKTTESPPEVARYLAWMDGDYQSDYEVDRKVADERTKQLEAKPPSPTDTDEYLEYLSVLDADGKYQDAEKKIKAYLADHPAEKRAVFLLGVHYWRTQKKELATHFFNQLEKDPTFTWKSLLYNDLGMIALQEKNRLAAIDYFDKATKATPSLAAPFVNLGALYLQGRSYLNAEPLFAKARALDGDFEDATVGLGACLEGQGKFEEAHKVYSDFMASHPNALTVLYNDSMLLGNRLKQKELAAQQMLKYIQRGGKETAKAQENIQSWR